MHPERREERCRNNNVGSLRVQLSSPNVSREKNIKDESFTRFIGIIFLVVSYSWRASEQQTWRPRILLNYFQHNDNLCSQPANFLFCRRESGFISWFFCCTKHCRAEYFSRQTLFTGVDWENIWVISMNDENIFVLNPENIWLFWLCCTDLSHLADLWPVIPVCVSTWEQVWGRHHQICWLQSNNQVGFLRFIERSPALPSPPIQMSFDHFCSSQSWPDWSSHFNTCQSSPRLLMIQFNIWGPGLTWWSG